MRFPHPHAAVNEQRIVGSGRRGGYRLRCRVSKLVAGTHHERIERKFSEAYLAGDRVGPTWDTYCIDPQITRPLGIIADGGIKNAGDCVKALTMADMVMIGNLFAGADETPG